jgi:hypothetical protein
MPKMTFQEYADHRGVTLQAVRKAAKQGRIDFLTDMMTAQPFVYSEKADEQWEKNTSKQNELGGKERKKRHDTWAKTDSSSPSYHEAQAHKEHFKAKLAELEYFQKAGKLVDADEVKEAFFDLARRTREALLTIPDRISPEIAAESDADKIYDKLTKEIRDALESLNAG